jgi:hypothetical protein
MKIEKVIETMVEYWGFFFCANKGQLQQILVE